MIAAVPTDFLPRLRRRVGARARTARARLGRRLDRIGLAGTSSTSPRSVPDSQPVLGGDDRLKRPSETRRLIARRFEWTETTGPHPRYVYAGERGATQRAARVAVTEMLKDHQYEDHACPSCGGEGFIRVAETERHGFYFPTCLCKNCGLLQAQPRPPESFYDEFYANHYRRLFEGTAAIDSPEAFRGRAARRPKGFVDWVARQPSFARNVGPSDLIVEVGCSAGMVVSQFADRGHRVIGLDLDDEFMQIGRDLGYDLRIGKLADLELDERPRMIYYHHVIEHIPAIDLEVQQCFDLLPEGGLLAIAVPGVAYIDQAYRSDLAQYLQIAHVYNFSLTSLCALMRPRGFELVAGDETVRALFRKSVAGRADDFYTLERSVASWRLNQLERRRRDQMK